VNAQPDTRLYGRRLTIARTACLAFFAFAALALLVAIPARWAELTHPTPTTLTNLNALGWPVTLYAAYSVTTEVIFTAAYLVVGLIIFARRSDDGMALFTALMLVAFGVGNGTITPTISALRQYPPGAVVSACLGFAAWLTFSQFPYLFPDGRYVPAWARVPALIWLLLCFVWNFMLGSPLDPFTWPPVLFASILLTLWGTWLVASVYRYVRVSNPIERQQTKWVVYALGMAIMVIIILFLITSSFFDYRVYLYLAFGESPTPQVLAFVVAFQSVARLALLLLPLGFAFSILRYRLWDIDLLIRKTLLYSILTTLLALTYFGSVIILQSVFAAVGGQRSELAIVASTLAIAALFLPLRRRVQNAIDRRFYRRKYDAVKTLAEFGQTARDETYLEKLTARLIEVVQETMQPESVSLWLKDFNAKTQRNKGAKKI
jgi:hypothetical protein